MICPKCGDKYEDDLPRCLWCNAPNPKYGRIEKVERKVGSVQKRNQGDINGFDFLEKSDEVDFAQRTSGFVEFKVAKSELAKSAFGLFLYFGLFLFFVVALKMGLSLISGALTLSIMVLPTIMRTTEEALLAVPSSYREGSFGLGAGRLRTTFKVVLPSAVPGILSGVILAVGRIVGETAALIYTAGTVAKVPDSVLDSTRTLAVHMYTISSEGLYINQSYATAVVLLVVVLGINGLSFFIAKRIGRSHT